MILSKEIRNQFSVFIFDHDENTALNIRSELVGAGYETFSFIDLETLLTRMDHFPPHVLIFSLSSVIGNLPDFIKTVLEKSPETLIITLGNSDQIKQLRDYRDYNFEGYIPLGKNNELEALWWVDQICEKLYYRYQNEQLFEQLQTQNKSTDSLKYHVDEKTKNIEILKSQLLNLEQNAVSSFKARTFCDKFNEGASKENLINLFFNQLQEKFLQINQKIFSIYFKFLPTAESFVATHGIGIDIETLKGVGAKLKKEELSAYRTKILEGVIPNSLHELMEDGLRVSDYVMQPLFIGNNLDGLFTFWLAETTIDINYFENEFVLFTYLYQNTYLTKKNHQLEIKDPITELFHRDYYLKRLNEEVMRARRIKLPVSVIKLSLNRYGDLEALLGSSNRDMILRMIGLLLTKTSRANDIVARTQENQISLILPHAARQGAAIRAERIRRLVENHSFSVSGEKITISCGVSEFPSLSSHFMDLDQSAEEALLFIDNRGGNKVCLYKARDTFIPEFQVNPI